MLVREAHKCGWIRTAAATSLKTAQKQPSGLFLAARLATSTRAHQKSSSVFSTLELFVLLVREAHKCGWIRTAAATSLKTAQKQPSGLFLAARLATSTRAHQKSSSVFSTLELFVLLVREAHKCGVDSNSIGPPNSPEGKKAPAGLF